MRQNICINLFVIKNAFILAILNNINIFASETSFLASY